jgi:LuxR family maltose regulon positive regulatory protein
MRLLDEAQPGHIVLACAPPGFGKSVTLAEWSDRVKKDGGHAAWLTLDAADEPATLVEYLRFAFHCAGLPMTSAEDSSPTAPLLRLQLLLATVEASDAPLLLVLDDVERASPAMTEVLDALCRFQPNNMILALATREASALDLSSYTERGLLTTLDTDALRFDKEEVQSLWGASATRAQVSTVEQRSGGWPALLQLMLQHGLTSHFDAGATTSGSASAAASFFEKRLLLRLDTNVRGALLRLSLLASFTPSLAAALLDTSATDTEATLARLSMLGVIATTRVDGGPEIAIYPLLRDYLAERFAAQEPQAAADTHRKAVQLFLRQKDFVAATRHAAALGDDEFLADVVEAVDPLLLGLREGFPRLRQIMRLIPDAIATSRPRIGYACVANSIKIGRLKEAERVFLALEGLAGKRTRSPTVQFERSIALSLLAIYKGTPITERDIGALDVFLAKTPSLAPIVRSLIETLRSFVYQQRGRFPEAETATRLSMACADEAGSAYVAYFSYCDLGMFAGLQGRTQEGFAHFDDGDRACASVVRSDERLGSIRDAFRLELQHETAPASAGSAARLKNICIRLPSLEGWPDVYSAAFRTFSEQLFLSDDLAGGLAILTVGLDYLREQGIAGAPTVLLAQRAMLLALAGRVDEAREELRHTKSSELPASRFFDRPWREAEALAEAEAAISLATSSKPKHLAHAIAHAQRTDNVRSEVRLRSWQLAIDGKVDAADEARLSALENASGFRRTAVLLAGKVQKHGGKSTEPKRASVTVLPSPVRSPYYLTPREFDVIACLERGLGDKAIAKELGITAHGVRYHLKRIYAKLHVSDRVEAREKAGKLGLM